MDRDGLRQLQAPLKSAYREDPASALITLHAEGRVGSEDVSCSVATGRALVEAGLHPASGGDGSFACSGDMLLQALVACAGVTLRSVATNRGMQVEGTVRAEGDLDFRGTMGVDREAAVLLGQGGELLCVGTVCILDFAAAPVFVGIIDMVAERARRRSE